MRTSSPLPNAMTSHAVMSFLKIFLDRCPNQSAIACELWFPCCCLACQWKDRGTIDFLFLWQVRAQTGCLCRWGRGGGRRHWLTERKDRQGLTRDTALRAECVYSMLSHTWVKPVQAEGVFTFSQVGDFSFMLSSRDSMITAQCCPTSKALELWNIKPLALSYRILNIISNEN